MKKNILILTICIIGLVFLTGCSTYMYRGTGPSDCYGYTDCWYAEHSCGSCNTCSSCNTCGSCY